MPVGYPPECKFHHYAFWSQFCLQALQLVGSTDRFFFFSLDFLGGPFSAMRYDLWGGGFQNSPSFLPLNSLSKVYVVSSNRVLSSISGRNPRALSIVNIINSIC